MAIDIPTDSAPCPSSTSDARSTAMAAIERMEMRSPSQTRASRAPPTIAAPETAGIVIAKPTTLSAHCMHRLPTTWMSSPTSMSMASGVARGQGGSASDGLPHEP